MGSGSGSGCECGRSGDGAGAELEHGPHYCAARGFARPRARMIRALTVPRPPRPTGVPLCWLRLYSMLEIAAFSDGCCVHCVLEVLDEAANEAAGEQTKVENGRRRTRAPAWRGMAQDSGI